MYYETLLLGIATVEGHLIILSDIVQGQNVGYASRVVPYGPISFQVTFHSH